jgi:polysaccharide deacetylase family protein (PEP-CTERM system associated)
MTVDVEDYFHVAALESAIPRERWNSMEYRAEENTRKLLAIFAQHELCATFFILGWVARRSPALVREIHAAGHEIACHGMSHELVYEQSRDQFAAETHDAKRLLEDTIGGQVFGYRAASWSITRRSLWALDSIHEAGFVYDSSIFPMRHDRYGIPGASQYPGYIDTPNGSRIVEFPPSTISVLGVRVPVAGGGYFRLFPYWLIRAGLRRINETLAQPFIFYVHPWEVDEGQPRFAVDWLSRVRHYTNLARTEQRLRKLLAEFSCTTAIDVLARMGLVGDLPLGRAHANRH